MNINYEDTIDQLKQLYDDTYEVRDKHFIHECIQLVSDKIKDDNNYASWKWDVEYSSFECSKCHTMLQADHLNTRYNLPKYCPYCGRNIKEVIT